MLFFSRSKDLDARYLSTMQVCELIIDGRVYLSMEHYFQSQKYPLEKQYMFEKGGVYVLPKDAKRAGGKGGMKKNKCALDLDRWNGFSPENPNDFHRIRIMKKAIWARFKQDKRFRDILIGSEKPFVHYEKKRGKYDPTNIPAWGSYCSKVGGWTGLNVLGMLYTEIAEHYQDIEWLGDTKMKWLTSKNPSIPHKTDTPKKEWMYAGFDLCSCYDVCLDSGVILHS